MSTDYDYTYKADRRSYAMVINGTTTLSGHFTYCCDKIDKNSYIYRRYIDLEQDGEQDISVIKKEDAIFLLTYIDPKIMKVVKGSKWIRDLILIAKN